MIYMIKIHLSTLLGAKRMTQKELSEKTNIRPATINEIYHELVERIKLDHVELICKALDCNISDLLEIVDDNKI